MGIARGVGMPLQLDKITREGIYGYYTRVLVEVDVSDTLPQFLNVERDDYEFHVKLVYENLPSKCSSCGAIGHDVAKCRVFVDDNNTRGRSHSRKPCMVYEPVGLKSQEVIVKSKTTPCQGEATVLASDAPREILLKNDQNEQSKASNEENNNVSSSDTEIAYKTDFSSDNEEVSDLDSKNDKVVEFADNPVQDFSHRDVGYMQQKASLEVDFSRYHSTNEQIIDGAKQDG
ncbi:Zinc knuckle CX2CX4HX4C [Melia azedarach]|uniref:Zinc knuckle CX2CX4HX4C n=1 Tax=Melia azedarach TaxID=155640 RepID=A0ACC1Y6C7_MELAZ|nr:Zinc knuckle CX2CX4HX4C [Melia azedarach]